MKFGIRFNGIAALAAVALFQSLPASAIPVSCESARHNQMFIDSAFVSSCVDGGLGEVLDDPSSNYQSIGSADYWRLPVLSPKLGSVGVFSFDESLWESWDDIAIGFKFAVANCSYDWFVYTLNQDVSAGIWGFLNRVHRGGGLSDVALYGVERAVPEPGTLGLFGAALLGVALARRRRIRPKAG